MDVYQATLRRLHEIEVQARRIRAVRDPHERSVAIRSLKAEKKRLTATLALQPAKLVVLSAPDRPPVSGGLPAGFVCLRRAYLALPPAVPRLAVSTQGEVEEFNASLTALPHEHERASD
jgi:hypothetical protein